MNTIPRVVEAGDGGRFETVKHLVDLKSGLEKIIKRVKLARDPAALNGIRTIVRSQITGKTIGIEVRIRYIETGAEVLKSESTFHGNVVVDFVVTKDTDINQWADGVLRQIKYGITSVERGRIALNNSNRTEIDRVSNLLRESHDWWFKMTPKEQADYLKAHPRSRMRKQYRFPTGGKETVPQTDQPEAPRKPRRGVLGWAKLIAGIP